MKSQKFVAIGNITHDIYGNEYRIGGSSVYSSITARNFGIKAGIVSNIGKDFKFHSILHKHNIDISYAICENTTTFRNVYINGRKQYVFKIADPITPTQIPYTFLNAEIIYICPVLNEIDSNILKLFKSRNSPLIGVSPQGWMRDVYEGEIRKKEWDNAKEILQYTDVLIFSEEDIPEYNSEIEEYTATKNLIVIVTKGKNGADLYFKGKIYHLPAYPTKEKDPTGAGDVFGAAFLIKYYESGDIIESARFATCAASFVVEKIGIDGIPKLMDVNKRCMQLKSQEVCD